MSAFLISTPESGIDSIAVTYALMDPIMTIARPTAAFITAAAAGIAENLADRRKNPESLRPDLRCPVDNCCDGVNCDPEKHKNHHTVFEKAKAGFGFAFKGLWQGMAGWFFLGLFLAGLITGFIPADLMSRYLGGGLPSMLVMLGVGIPLYICATASTPIAAAFILKGVSPGAALVFLLAGPATNITSITVLLATFGKRSTAIYVGAIAISSVICGLILDWIYGYFAWSAKALLQSPKEIVPEFLEILGALFLGALSIKPLIRKFLSVTRMHAGKRPASETNAPDGQASLESPLTLGKCSCGKPT